MNYTMEYATKGSLELTLDRCGRDYKVMVYDKDAHMITFRADFDHTEYEKAKELFRDYIEKYGFSEATETNIDFYNID